MKAFWLARKGSRFLLARRNSRARHGLNKKRLPSYTVPSTVHHFESLPLNASGQVNRQELAELVVQGKLNAAK
jgi:hypothetical protein